MRYEYCPNDPNRFSTGLRRVPGTELLQWDNAAGQDVLLVQTPFQVKATDKMEEICQRLESITLHPDKYTEVLPGVWVRFVTVSMKAQYNGYPFNTEASTYTVFSYCMDEDLCRIYAPKDLAMITSYCDIPMELQLRLREIKHQEGPFWRRREVFSGFFSLELPTSFAASYHEGDLAYRIGELCIPITAEMFRMGMAYIRADQRPEFISRNKGLTLNLI